MVSPTAISIVKVSGNPGPAVVDFGSADRLRWRVLLRKLVIVSAVFLACGLANAPFIAAPIFVAFLFYYIRGRLAPTDFLLVILAVEPWLGPSRMEGFHLDRGLAALALISLWAAKGQGTKRLLTNKIDSALFIFVIACLISILLPSRLMIRTPVRIFLDAILIPTGYYVIAKNCVHRRDLLPKLFVAVVVAIIGFGTLGVFEGITKMDVLSYGEEPLDPFRINGPMRMAEDYGLCMNLLLLFYLGMRSLRPASPFGRRVLWLVPLLGVVNCYLTLMRGLWLSLTAGLLAQDARRNLGRFLRVVPVMAVIVWVFMKGVLPAVAPDVVEKRLNNERTFNARIATYKSALAMFEDYPIMGVGFASFPEMFDNFPGRYERDYKGEPSVTLPHNIFMLILAETGVVGTVCFLFFLWQIFRGSLYLWKHGLSVEHREYATFALSALTAYVVQGLGLHPIASIDFPNKYFFIFLGLLSGMLDAVRGGHCHLLTSTNVGSVST